MLSYMPNKTGQYDVWIKWNFTGGDEDARIEIFHEQGVSGFSFDQKNTSGWHFAGTYNLNDRSEIAATNRSIYPNTPCPEPVGFDEVRLVPTTPRVVEITAWEGVSVCELNVGDTLVFTLANGEKRKLVLKGVSAKAIERVGADVRRYCFTMDFDIDGKNYTFFREAPTDNTLNAEPFEVSGMQIWPDSVADLFHDGGGFMLEKDFRFVAGTCRPMRRARIAFQDATLRIIPEKTVWWWPAPSWPLSVKNCYNGRDCWMGPWYAEPDRGGETHCGTDINMPAHTPLRTPFAVDEQHYFHRVDRGSNNNRWRGIRRWNNGQVWWIQSHHIDTVLLDEGGPLAADTVYALSGGQWCGEFTHTHFNLRIFKEVEGPDGERATESFWLNPGLVFRQMALDNPIK